MTITPRPVIGRQADHVKVAVNVTNTFPDNGGFTVTKHVTGETGGYVANSTFTVHYVCTGPTRQPPATSRSPTARPGHGRNLPSARAAP